MKIGVLGTGMVGQTIGSKLIAVGHEVKMGGRQTSNEKAVAWARGAGAGASHGTFADAAAFGEIVFNATLGAAALDALGAAGADNLRGKILVDVSNPLDFSKGMPPSLFTGSADSLGERIQRSFPEAKVVKALNTINVQVMVDPGRLAGADHEVFVSGNDAGAKTRVAEILKDWFGWKRVIDLGDITTARGAESYVVLWACLWGVLGTTAFNLKIVR
jgi:8-hydroxy-5-deazaflavin:NADPH oxidoreductase